MYMNHRGLRRGREIYSITSAQHNSYTFWFLSTSRTNPHDEHKKYVLQVVQVQVCNPLHIKDYIWHFKRWNYCKQLAQESSVDMSFRLLTTSKKYFFTFSPLFPWPLLWYHNQRFKVTECNNLSLMRFGYMWSPTF